MDNLRANSMDIVANDIDKDGDPDLIIAMEFRPNVILLNDGHAKFSVSNVLSAKNHDSEDIAAEDFDRDGDVDIVFVSEDDKIHEYYINKGNATFDDASEKFPVSSKCNAVIAHDFDKDGDIDLILGNEGQDIFLANDGKGNFTDETTKRLPVDQSTTQDIETFDLDKDGDFDLIFGNEDGNRIYLNDGKGGFTDATQERLPITPEAEETRKVDLADIDKDGDLDIFFSNVNFRKNKNPANRILVNNGKGFFTDETTTKYLGKNDLHTADVSFADLDQDKDLDMVIANVFGGAQQVFLNDGKGIFTEQPSNYLPTSTTEAISVEVTDLNKDGLPDIYFGIFRGTDVLLLGGK